jgi:hypothetical protein
MAENIERLAAKLGASIEGQVSEYSAGAFGIAKLAEELRGRLEPGSGRRQGRPTDRAWTRRPKVPMAPETEARLRALARLLSAEDRKVSPMQVAAEILEKATASYFARRPLESMPSSRPRT